MKGVIPRVVFKASLFSLFILLFSVFTLGVSATSNDTRKTEGLEGAIKTEVVESIMYDKNEEYGPTKTPAGCTVKTFHTRRHLGINSIIPRDKFTNCAIEISPGTWLAKKGYITYLQQSDMPLAGKINGIDRYFRTFPGENIIFERGYVDGKIGVKVTDSFTEQLTPKFNIVTGQLSYEFDETNNYILADDRGIPKWGTTTTSRFGIRLATSRYLVLDYSGGSLIRVDRETHEALRYGAGSYSSNTAIVRLNSDGRYSARTRGGEAYIYDLDNCANSPPRSSRHRTYYSSDCDYLNLSRYLQQELSLGGTVLVKNIDFDGPKQLRAWFTASYDDQLREVRLALGDSGFRDNYSYIALGDSFASGEGDMDDSWYEPGTNVSENKCHLSRRSYPYLLADQLNIEDFHSVACSGAKYDEVRSTTQKNIEGKHPANDLGDWYPGVKPQLKHLVDEYSSPSAVTISIGGNDAGFASKLQECVIGPGTCKYAEDSAYRSYVAMEIASLHDPLKNTYEEIARQTEQKTKIFVIGYPQFVKGSGGSCGLNVGLNDDERVFINKATAYMNKVIEAAAVEAGVYYLDMEDSLDGSNLCSFVSDQEMAVNGLTIGDDVRLPRILSFTGPILATLGQIGIGKESYHPNQNGQQLLQQRISALTANDLLSFDTCDDNLLICPSGARIVPVPDVDYWGSTAVKFAQLYGVNPHQNLPDYPHRLDIIKENLFDGVVRQIKVSLNNLQPGSLVNFTLNSDPIDLGSYQADAGGELEATLEIPEDIEPGTHSLSASTKNILGEEEVYYEPVIAYWPSDSNEQCGLIAPSGTDVDHDGIDDACDGHYEEYIELAEETENSQDSADEYPDETTPIPLGQINTELELQLGLVVATSAPSASSVHNTPSSLQGEIVATNSHQTTSNYSQVANTLPPTNTLPESQDAEETLGSIIVSDNKETFVGDSGNNKNFVIWATIAGLVSLGVAVHTVNKRRQ